MEKMINIHVERLPEGVYLATSEDIQGLVAQGRALWKHWEIARTLRGDCLMREKNAMPTNRSGPLHASSITLLSLSADNGQARNFKYREIIRRLKRSGFVFDRQAAGSHEIWFNPSTNLYTTVPNHPGNMPQGTLRAIIRQAGISVEDFLKAD